jgi:hypothetical protein
MGPQNLLSLRFLTHSIFAFEKEVSWRDRKKSYNRYFTAALPHPSSRADGKGGMGRPLAMIKPKSFLV